MRPIEKAIVQPFIAPRLLIYVFGEIRSGDNRYEATALISDTGMVNGGPEFAGMAFAVKDNEVIPLGERYVMPWMVEGKCSLEWGIEGGSLPSLPFFLTDDSSQRIILDRRVKIAPSGQLNLARVRGPFGVTAMNQNAVLCPIMERWLGLFRRRSRNEYRLIVIGDKTDFPDAFEVWDNDYLVGTARFVDDVG